MAQKDIKNLTVAELMEKGKVLDQVSDFYINIGGEEYKMTYDVKFKKSKQYLIMDDLVKFLEEGRERMELFDLVTPYTTLLILKHFTSLDVSDDIDEAVTLLNVLVDLDVLGDMLNALPDEEMIGTFEMIEDAVKSMTANINEFLEEAEKLELENPELLEADGKDVEKPESDQ